MKEIEKNIAVIGAGYWGKNLVRVFRELGVLKAVCDINKTNLNLFHENYPEIKVTDSKKEILEDKDIKAVAIATPATTHYELVKDALIAGKDVFVEKPLTLNIEKGNELVGLAKKHSKILMVGHILHYHPAMIKLKEIISNGELGKIQYIYSNRLNIGKFRTEENILWSFAPHDVSAIIMLLNEEPNKVSTFGGDYLNLGIYDTTLTCLEFKNGVKGHIFVSWLHPYKEQKLVVVGSKAMAVFDDLSEEKLFLYLHEIEWKDGKVPVAHKVDYCVVKVEKLEPLKLELQHFIECVQERKKPKTDGYEGLKVLKVLELCENDLLRKSKP